MAIERVDSFFGGRVKFTRELEPGKSFSVTNAYNDVGNELTRVDTTVRVLDHETVEKSDMILQYVVDGKKVPVPKPEEREEYIYRELLKGDAIDFETTACLGWMLGWVQHYRFVPSKSSS